MAMNGVKMEDDVHIKPDPETSPQGGFADDDDYEDTGELSIPAHNPPFWLGRTPKWLWEVLANAPEDEEIEIGEILVYDNPRNPSEQSIKMRLYEDKLQNKSFPTDYEVIMTKKESTNTYVFSEKDLPGYKPGAYHRSRPIQTGSDPKGGSYRVHKQGRRGRKAIPKHTALLGAPNHEVTIVAEENDKYRSFMEERAREAMENVHRQTLMTDQVHANTSNLDAFGKAFITDRITKPRTQENKAQRIPENELLDMLYRLFERHKYWRMNSLRQETNQPESYLREVLNKIAFMPKSGVFNGTWTLKSNIANDLPPEGMNMEEYASANIAPEAPGGAGGGGAGGGGGGGSGAGAEDYPMHDDDDDEPEMEDVI